MTFLKLKLKLVIDIMAERKLLNPPPLTGVDNIHLWLHDLQIWMRVTELAKKQQGPIKYLLLLDKIRNSCRDISLEHLNQEDSLKEVNINELRNDNMKNS